MDGTSAPAPITNPFQLEVAYAYRRGFTSSSEYFLIDVVSLDNILEFLQALETNEVTTMVEDIREGEYKRNMEAGPRGIRR